MATALKAVEEQSSVGSNPTPVATSKGGSRDRLYKIKIFWYNINIVKKERMAVTANFYKNLFLKIGHIIYRLVIYSGVV